MTSVSPTAVEIDLYAFLCYQRSVWMATSWIRAYEPLLFPLKSWFENDGSSRRSPEVQSLDRANQRLYWLINLYWELQHKPIRTLPTLILTLLRISDIHSWCASFKGCLCSGMHHGVVITVCKMQLFLWFLSESREEDHYRSTLD